MKPNVDRPINIGKFLIAHGAKPTKQSKTYIWSDPYSDKLRYISPLSGKEINSRTDRHREMRTHNVREVDTSEKNTYHSKDPRGTTKPTNWDF